MTTTTTRTTTKASVVTKSTTTKKTTKVPAAKFLDGDAMLSLINAERERLGLSTLSIGASLTSSARVRAKEICTSFSHTRPNGKNWDTVLNKTGLTMWGENIAAGTNYTKVDLPFDAWMNSPGHYANMIKDGFNRVGIVGYYCPDGKYKYYWAQLFSS